MSVCVCASVCVCVCVREREKERDREVEKEWFSIYKKARENQWLNLGLTANGCV